MKLVRQYGPGIWEYDTGALHVSVPEVLEAAGLPDTPENCERVIAEFRTLVFTKNPEARVIWIDGDTLQTNA